MSLPPEVLKRIQQEGILDQESHPLYLPRHSIRFLIIAAFVGLGVYLYQHQKLLNDPRAMSLLSSVTAIKLFVERRQQTVARTAASLHALSPLQVLSRGFSLTQTADGNVLRDARQVATGDMLIKRSGAFHGRLMHLKNEGWTFMCVARPQHAIETEFCVI